MMQRRSELRIITQSELAQHNKLDDCWVVLHGRVYDVTRFLPEHPGGSEVVACLAGSDGTSEFEEIGHSITSRQQALMYEIGILEGMDEKAALGAMAGKSIVNCINKLVRPEVMLK